MREQDANRLAASHLPAGRCDILRVDRQRPRLFIVCSVRKLQLSPCCTISLHLGAHTRSETAEQELTSLTTQAGRF